MITRLFPIFLIFAVGCVGTDLVTPNLEKLELINPISELAVGDTYQFETRYTNSDGNVETPAITWRSSNELVATVTDQGVVTGVSLGKAMVFYATNGIEEKISFDVAENTVTDVVKTATLQGSSGYKANGTATLTINDADELILELSADFETDFALGTFIYLANTTSGQQVKSSGLDLGQVTSGGAKTFVVSNVSPSAGINTYSHIVVLCKPAGITFGFGKFN